MRRSFAMICASALWVLATCPAAHAALFEYLRVAGTRTTASGAARGYDLFIPTPAEGQPAPPFPAVVIMHGLFSSHLSFANHGIYGAQRGMVVLTVDVTESLGSEVTNASDLADWIKWVAKQNTVVDSPLFGLVDKTRLGVAGHSAGGPLAFEAAHQLQGTQYDVSGICLLDGVPADVAYGKAPTFNRIALASFTAEPGCNGDNANSNHLLSLLTFPTEDVHWVGAHHCDMESPVDTTLCSPFCGGTSTDISNSIKRQVYLFFQDALGVPSVEDSPQTYAMRLNNLTGQGKVIRTAYGPTPTPSPSPSATASPTPQVCDGCRFLGDFDLSGCTDIADFLFLLDYWEVEAPGYPGSPIGLADFLALLDGWQTGPSC